MSAQTTEPTLPHSNEYLSFSGNRALTLKMIHDLLREGSTLKKGVNHDPSTVISSANALLGAMAPDASLETMDQIYTVITEVVFQQMQRLAAERGLPAEVLVALESLCDEIRKTHPFAHRTTVQGMLNGHKKINSDQWLNQSFQQSIKELDAAGYKPPRVAIN